MLRFNFLTICICIAFFSFCGISAYGSYDVYMQESPPGSGVVMPGVGMHTYQDKENITLTTAPKAGYRFVGWLGDVRDPAANRTSLVVDGPKIIIAVFERDEYAFEEKGPQISVGPEALFPRSDSYTNSNSVGDADDYDPDDPDYPEDEPDPVPVPTPEPTTMVLLGIGAWLVNKRKNDSK
jgi:hypothetical protein